MISVLMPLVALDRLSSNSHELKTLEQSPHPLHPHPLSSFSSHLWRDSRTLSLIPTLSTGADRDAQRFVRREFMCGFDQ